MSSIRARDVQLPPPNVGEWGGGGGTKTLFIRVAFGWRSKYLNVEIGLPLT